jgi:hypothetical protein
MKTTQAIALNSVKDSPPPLGKNVLLWIEVESTLLDCGWVKAQKVSDLPVEPLIDFEQPGINKELVWISEGVPQEMHEDHLWSPPIITKISEPLVCTATRV